MKQTLKKAMSVLLAVIMLFGMEIFSYTVNIHFPNAKAASFLYDVEAAMNFAKSHCDQCDLKYPNNKWKCINNWECAEFVSNCLTAGGISVMQKGVSGLIDTLEKGGYGTLLKLSSSYTKDGQVAKMSSNQNIVKVGDPLFTYCSGCKKYTHTVICSGVDSSGFITIYGHNSRKNNGKYYADCGNGHSASYISIYSFSMNTHSHSYAITQTVSATCTTDGYYVYTCSCGDSYTEVNKKAFGHSYTTLERIGLIHPHYSVYSCVCGKTYLDETKLNFVSKCEKCNPSSYDITYNANGGNIAPAAQTGKGTISVSSDVPERFGYSFLGWSENSDATQASYLPGQTINLNSNLNLYAVWEEAKTIRIANADSVNFQFPGQVYYFQYTPTETRAWMIEYFRLPEDAGVFSTGEGLGLYLYDSNGNLLAAARNEANENDISCFLNSNEQYYIKIDFSENATGEIYVGMIKLKDYTISYNANGGNNAPESQTKIQYTPLILSYALPTKYNTITYNANGGSVSPSTKTLKCEFVNWNTAQNGSGTSYSPGDSYTKDENITLYAQWESPVAGTLETPICNGYTFDGWYTAADGGRKVSSTTKINSDITLYAHWNPITNSCSRCNRQFTDFSMSNLHSEICVPNTDKSAITYICSYCGDMFTSKTAFSAHIVGCSEKPDITVGSINNTCPNCAHVFSDEAEYNNHIQSCITVYACDYCKAEFRSNSACNEHKKNCSYAPAEPTTKPTEPTTKPVTPPGTDIVLEIRNPSTTTIAYGDSIILHADINGTLPAGWRIDWSASNGNFAYSESADGTACTITPSASGNTEFTATVYDSEGKEVSKDTQIMTSNAGFFQKIIAFFKSIFGLNKVFPELIKKSMK